MTVVQEGSRENGYNFPCDCDQFLTPNNNVAEQSVCDNNVRTYAVDEPTDVVSSLPFGTCQGPGIAPKSWDMNSPLTCESSPPPPTTPTVPTGGGYTCEDSYLKFQVEREDGHMMWRDCEWVEENHDLCEDFEGAASHCPKT